MAVVNFETIKSVEVFNGHFLMEIIFFIRVPVLHGAVTL